MTISTGCWYALNWSNSKDAYVYTFTVSGLKEGQKVVAYMENDADMSERVTFGTVAAGKKKADTNTETNN